MRRYVGAIGPVARRRPDEANEVGEAYHRWSNRKAEVASVRTTIRGKNLTVSDKDRAYIERKMQRLERMLDDRSEADVELRLEGNRKVDDSHIVDVTVSCPPYETVDETNSMSSAHYTTADKLVINLDQTLRTLFGRPLVTERSNPADPLQETDLPEKTREHTARLMRINHTGEVCAQALYQGQALTAHQESTRRSMARAAAEENDHLDWCESRVEELGGRLSLLNPFWYAGSFMLGAAAGIAGDRWSLGFVAET